MSRTRWILRLGLTGGAVTWTLACSLSPQPFPPDNSNTASFGADAAASTPSNGSKGEVDAGGQNGSGSSSSGGAITGSGGSSSGGGFGGSSGSSSGSSGVAYPGADASALSDAGGTGTSSGYSPDAAGDATAWGGDASRGGEPAADAGDGHTVSSDAGDAEATDGDASGSQGRFCLDGSFDVDGIAFDSGWCFELPPVYDAGRRTHDSG